ncbi:MAG: GNAT family N-acetyltransferase [Candidatus Daviesbacteria bacterium]|nr:GNAT family N-acetyltransferase [Candidatus Daviesbacteria bacterium]
MTRQDFEEVVKIIGDDPKYRHFIDRIKKDFDDSEHKGIPVAMHAYFIKEGKESIGFCILSLSPLKMRRWEKTFIEEDWKTQNFQIDISSFELMYLYIKPEFRRKGKATQLFNKVIKRSKVLGIKSIYAYVSDTDNAALEFYRKSGAKIIHDFSDETEGISAAFMVWKLE